MDRVDGTCYLCGGRAALKRQRPEDGWFPGDLVECPTCLTYIITISGRDEVTTKEDAKRVLSERTRDHFRTTGTPLIVDYRRVGSAEAEALISFGVKA